MKHLPLLVGLALFACGPRVSTVTAGGEGTEADAEPSDGNNPDVPGSELDAGVPNPCDDGLLFCDGECVDPSTNNNHCGRCGNQCDNLWTIGPCENGTCPPNYMCGGDRTDYRDCNEVCEALGTSCVDGIGCSGAHAYFYGIQGLSRCLKDASGNNLNPDATCSTPIDWERKGGLFLEDPVAVECCCLQE